jgi:hypothetical protein
MRIMICFIALVGGLSLGYLGGAAAVGEATKLGTDSLWCYLLGVFGGGMGALAACLGGVMTCYFFTPSGLILGYLSGAGVAVDQAAKLGIAAPWFYILGIFGGGMGALPFCL